MDLHALMLHTIEPVLYVQCECLYRVNVLLAPPCPQISDALNRRRNRKGMRLRYAPSVYVDGLLVPRGSGIAVDATALELLGIRHVAEVCSVSPSRRRGVGPPPDPGSSPPDSAPGGWGGAGEAAAPSAASPSSSDDQQTLCLSSPTLPRRWNQFSILPSATSPSSSAKTSRSQQPLTNRRPQYRLTQFSTQTAAAICLSHRVWWWPSSA